MSSLSGCLKLLPSGAGVLAHWPVKPSSAPARLLYSNLEKDPQGAAWQCTLGDLLPLGRPWGAAWAHRGLLSHHTGMPCGGCCADGTCWPCPLLLTAASTGAISCNVSGALPARQHMAHPRSTWRGSTVAQPPLLQFVVVGPKAPGI